MDSLESSPSLSPRSWAFLGLVAPAKHRTLTGMPLASSPYSLPQSRRGVQNQRATHGEEDLVRTAGEEVCCGQWLRSRPIREAYDRPAEEYSHGKPHYRVCQRPSPRSSSDPSDNHTEAPVLDRLEEGQ